MISPETFLQAVRQRGRKEPVVALGTIDPSYMGGRPRVQFDGEGRYSERTYPYLASYTPQPGDRVLLVRAGRTWVVVGRIE